MHVHRSYGWVAMALECRLKDWKLWTLTVPAFSFVLATDLAALGYAGWEASRVDSVAGLLGVLTLTGSSLLAVEGARRVESRRRSRGPLHKDLGPSWLIAASIALQPLMAIMVALLLRSWWRIRSGRCIPYRWVFSTAVLVLGAGASHYTYTGLAGRFGSGGLGEVLAMGAASTVFIAIDCVVCGVCIRLVERGRSLQEAFGGPDEFAVDLTVAGLGCLVAAAAMTSPWAVVFAVPIALTAQRALLLRQFETAAQTDAKTGLDRLSWWREQVAGLLARGDGEPVAILLIDIDHFKQINDVHGHLVGDEALRAVSTILRGAIRSKDVIGRFGGEEFVVALPDTGATDAEFTADRLRAAVAGSPLAAMLAGVLDDPTLDPRTLQLTVSIGVAVSPRDGTTLDGLLAAADRAMYAAKLAGRDRVRVADPVRPRLVAAPAAKTARESA
ncbi:MAG TPA: GGDEF domain-containing protein [Kribbellaceae bacterium]|nr:GGDEF domain-containing protein [Kribbellaceae bacterium]